MITLEKGFCVFLSVAGSFYCIWLLRDCWQQVEFRKKPVAPSIPSGHRDSKSTRSEWVCQLVLAVAAIWLAVTLVVANGSEVFSPLWQSKTRKQQLAKQTESTFSRGDFGVRVDHDTSRIDLPVIGIDCAYLQVSDEQVTYLLHKAPELEWLNLSRAPITGDVLGELRHTPSLRGLTLACPQITDDELVHLEGLTALCAVNLTDTQVTDKGLVHLEGLTNLHRLDLANTQVTDEGLFHLAKLINLRVLYLTGTRVTIKGLAHLEGLTNLHQLYLGTDQITDEDVKELQQVLPACKITR